MTRKQKGFAYWAAHLDAIKREGVSKTDYAQHHGISIKRLYYWQRKLKAATAPEPRIAASEPKTFVALRVETPERAQRGAACTLVLGSGIRMEMSALPAPEWLVTLGRAAQGER
jgi:transposase